MFIEGLEQALRANFPKTNDEMLTHYAETGVLVALLHETLNREEFASIADLCEAVKTRAARLRIPYDADRLAEAVQLVYHSRPLVRR